MILSIGIILLSISILLLQSEVKKLKNRTESMEDFLLGEVIAENEADDK